MGFKANKRKGQQGSGKEKGRKRRSKELGDGEKPCAIKDCNNWADKSHGGRSIAKDNLSEVWEDGELVGQSRRLSICKPHYRHYKKEKKDDERENW